MAYTILQSQICNIKASPLDIMHSDFRGEVIYNAETDVYFPHLTVGDTLLFVSSGVGKPILGLVCQFARQSGKCQVGKPWQTVNIS